MSRPADTERPDWDETVDVICVGTNPGVRAYLQLCAAQDLDVLDVGLPAVPDPVTADYLAAMTAGLEGVPDEPPRATRAARVPAPAGRRRTVEPFVGEDLRRWSVRCLASSSGLLFTEVPGLLKPVRTDTGELITAAAVPVDGPAAEDPVETYAGPVVEYGRIAGAVLDAGGTRRLVRAETGLVFAVGRSAGDPPTGPARALVGRRGGRFARLETLVVDEGD